MANVLETQERVERLKGLRSEERAFALIRKYPGVAIVSKTPRAFFYDADVKFYSTIPLIHDAKVEVKSSQAYVEEFLTEALVRNFQLKDASESLSWRLSNRLIVLNAGSFRPDDKILESFKAQLDAIIAFYRDLKLGPYNQVIR